MKLQFGTVMLGSDGLEDSTRDRGDGWMRRSNKNAAGLQLRKRICRCDCLQPCCLFCQAGFHSSQPLNWAARQETATANRATPVATPRSLPGCLGYLVRARRYSSLKSSSGEKAEKTRQLFTCLPTLLTAVTTS